MNALRRARPWGRLLAAWLLLWFLTMGLMPIGPVGAQDAQAAAVVLLDEHCAPAEGHAAHDHSGHAAGGTAHCPLCTHAAAPPAAEVAQGPAPAAPADAPLARERAPLRVRTAAPPPARGPPILS